MFYTIVVTNFDHEQYPAVGLAERVDGTPYLEKSFINCILDALKMKSLNPSNIYRVNRVSEV